MCIYIHTMRVCVYLSLSLFLSLSIHTYIYIYTYTHIYTHSASPPGPKALSEVKSQWARASSAPARSLFVLLLLSLLLSVINIGIIVTVVVTIVVTLIVWYYCYYYDYCQCYYFSLARPRGWVAQTGALALAACGLRQGRTANVGPSKRRGSPSRTGDVHMPFPCGKG